MTAKDLTSFFAGFIPSSILLDIQVQPTSANMALAAFISISTQLLVKHGDKLILLLWNKLKKITEPQKKEDQP